MIHPTAIIASDAEIDEGVEVGPYVVIDGGVRVGAGCRLGPHVHLIRGTVMGNGNIIHTGAVIGDEPQDLKYDGSPTHVRIGDGNIFREHATVHRSNTEKEDTVIGSHNFLMAHSHVGHNAQVGDHVVIANGALLAGHVTVMDHAIISGNCLVHQFTRVGKRALMQGGAAISMDLPPFMIASGYNRLSGLNTVGMRRAGISQEERSEMKRLYLELFRSGRNLREAVEHSLDSSTGLTARTVLEFIRDSHRGVCPAREHRH